MYYKKKKKKKKKTPSISLALQNLFYRLYVCNDPINCRELIRSFGWDASDAFTQHDTHELLKLLLDKVEEQMKDTPAEGSVKNMFEGEMETYIECLDINYKSCRRETFEDLQLDVLGCRDLEESLKKSLQPEILDGENMYDAEGYGKQRAHKGIKYLRFPAVLIFQLKRFSFDLQRMDTVKLNDRFEFSTVIDMSDYCQNSGQYILHAVQVHQGDINSGHYYVFIRSWGKNKWYRFDDDKVYAVSEYAAVGDNFGGEELDTYNYLIPENNNNSNNSFNDNNKFHSHSHLTQHMQFNNNNNNARSKHYSAYILVYVKKDLAQELLAECDPKIVNPQVVERCCMEEKLHDKRQKLKKEFCQNIKVKVFTPEQFIGKSFLEQPYDSKPKFTKKFKRTTSLYDVWKAINDELSNMQVADDEKNMLFLHVLVSDNTCRFDRMLIGDVNKCRRNSQHQPGNLLDWFKKTGRDLLDICDPTMYILGVKETATIRTIVEYDMFLSSQILVMLKYFDVFVENPSQENLICLGYQHVPNHTRVRELQFVVFRGIYEAMSLGKVTPYRKDDIKELLYEYEELTRNSGNQSVLNNIISNKGLSLTCTLELKNEAKKIDNRRSLSQSEILSGDILVWSITPTQNRINEQEKYILLGSNTEDEFSSSAGDDSDDNDDEDNYNNNDDISNIDNNNDDISNSNNEDKYFNNKKKKEKMYEENNNIESNNNNNNVEDSIKIKKAEEEVISENINKSEEDITAMKDIECEESKTVEDYVYIKDKEKENNNNKERENNNNKERENNNNNNMGEEEKNEEKQKIRKKKKKYIKSENPPLIPKYLVLDFNDYMENRNNAVIISARLYNPLQQLSQHENVSGKLIDYEIDAEGYRRLSSSGQLSGELSDLSGICNDGGGDVDGSGTGTMSNFAMGGGNQIEIDEKINNNEDDDLYMHSPKGIAFKTMNFQFDQRMKAKQVIKYIAWHMDFDPSQVFIYPEPPLLCANIWNPLSINNLYTQEHINHPHMQHNINHPHNTNHPCCSHYVLLNLRDLLHILDKSNRRGSGGSMLNLSTLQKMNNNNNIIYNNNIPKAIIHFGLLPSIYKDWTKKPKTSRNENVSVNYVVQIFNSKIECVGAIMNKTYYRKNKKNRTVGDFIEELREKIDENMEKKGINKNGPLRLIDICTSNNKFISVDTENLLSSVQWFFSHQTKNMFACPLRLESDFSPQQKTLIAQSQLQVLSVFHQTPDKEFFGHPFQILVKPNDTVGEIKRIIKEKLKLSKSEWEKWSFFQYDWVHRSWRANDDTLDFDNENIVLIAEHPMPYVKARRNYVMRIA